MKAAVCSIATVLLMAVAVSAQTFIKETPIPKFDVPDVVLNAFKSAYPHSEARGYTKVEVDGTPFYKIESVEKGTHRDISYGSDGSVAKIEERILAADLPAAAQQAIREKYPDAKISFAEKVSQRDQLGYNANVKQRDKLFHLEFDANGKLTSAREGKINIVINQER